MQGHLRACLEKIAQCLRIHWPAQQSLHRAGPYNGSSMGAFDHQARVLLCGNCGAPLAVANEGGDTRCDYCEATTRVRPREEAPVAPPDRAPLSEEERLRRLRAQDGTPLRGPSTLPFSLIGWNGSANPKKYALCMETWKQARQRIESGAAEKHDEDHIYFLTLVLSNYYSRTKELDKLRATTETAVESCKKPRHRQVLLCMLARYAAKSGDTEAAKQWLEPCDSRSDDIHQDSAWRYANAYIATCDGRYHDVTEILGMRTGDVPIADFYEHTCAMMRANAHEKVGDDDTAIEVLAAALDQVRSSPRIFAEIARNAGDLDLCPRSWPRVYGPRMLRWRLRWWGYTLIWIGAMAYFLASWISGEPGDGWSFPVRNVAPALVTLVVGSPMWIRWRP
jgi:hypothetical protein